MDAVEAVARALYVAKGAHNVFGPWEAQLYHSLKEPFRRQAKALVEPIVAEAFAAARPFIAAECAAAIPAIMQDEWDEICNDTGCHPEDIYRASPRDRKTWYKHGHWTRAIAAAIKETIR